MAYIIAISNEKGGVAKTTSTLSLGAALAEAGQKVLLVDLDPQANLSLALGFEPGRVAHTSSDILLDNTPLLEAIIETNIAGVEMVTANPSLEQAEQVLPIYLNYTTRLRNTIEGAGTLPYNFILVDCP